MKRLIAGVALLITMHAASAQNIFEISPDSSNSNYANCKFQTYDDSALLITTYMGSLVAGKYEKTCSAEFLTQAKDGKRKHDAMLLAIQEEILKRQGIRVRGCFNGWRGHSVIQRYYSRSSG
jgi:hypothetical protein